MSTSRIVVGFCERNRWPRNTLKRPLCNPISTPWFLWSRVLCMTDSPGVNDRFAARRHKRESRRPTFSRLRLLRLLRQSGGHHHHRHSLPKAREEECAPRLKATSSPPPPRPPLLSWYIFVETRQREHNKKQPTLLHIKVGALQNIPLVLRRRVPTPRLRLRLRGGGCDGGGWGCGGAGWGCAGLARTNTSQVSRDAKETPTLAGIRTPAKTVLLFAWLVENKGNPKKAKK